MVTGFDRLFFKNLKMHLYNSIGFGKFQTIRDKVNQYLKKPLLIIEDFAKNEWFALIKSQNKFDILH